MTLWFHDPTLFFGDAFPVTAFTVLGLVGRGAAASRLWKAPGPGERPCGPAPFPCGGAGLPFCNISAFHSQHAPFIFFPVNPGKSMTVFQLPCTVLSAFRGRQRLPARADRFHVNRKVISALKIALLGGETKKPKQCQLSRTASGTAPRPATPSRSTVPTTPRRGAWRRRPAGSPPRHRPLSRGPRSKPGAGGGSAAAAGPPRGGEVSAGAARWRPRLSGGARRRARLRPGSGVTGSSPPRRWRQWQPAAAAGSAFAASGDPVLPRCARPLHRTLLSWRSQDGGPGLHPGQAGDQLLLQREERQGAGAGRRPPPHRLPRRLPPLPRWGGGRGRSAGGRGWRAAGGGAPAEPGDRGRAGKERRFPPPPPRPEQPRRGRGAAGATGVPLPRRADAGAGAGRAARRGRSLAAARGMGTAAAEPERCPYGGARLAGPGPGGRRRLPGGRARPRGSGVCEGGAAMFRALPAVCVAAAGEVRG